MNPLSNIRKSVYVSAVIPVYRDAQRAISLVHKLLLQRLPQQSRLEIILIDDGSDDGTAERIDSEIGHEIRLFRMDRNSGRALARNHATKKASGDVILFIDCDCEPANDGLIEQHLAAWTENMVASVGPTEGNGSGFWHRYQSDASARRAHQHATGINYSGASSNMMVARSAFSECGGFDPLYRAYGFEDRDLLVRLLALGAIAWAPDAVVRHLDMINLQTVSRKMLEAGMHSSAKFSTDHPEAYRALGYAALDARLHPWLRLPATAAGPSRDALARLGDIFLEKGMLPYSIKRAYVKVVTAMSYLSGTARACRESADNTHVRK